MMNSVKVLIVGLLALICAANIAAQKKSSRETKIKPPPTVSPCAETAPDLNVPTDNMKIIAEGSAGKVTAPFVYVARSAAGFENLRALVADLPAADEIDFNKSAVVAAFAGEKRSGGYAVKIGQTGAAVNVAETAPPPDALTTDALTYPFQIAVVPTADNAALDVNIPADWRQSARNYKITGGSIDYAGGIAGIMKTQPVEGTIRILTAGDLISLVFDFAGKEAANKDKKISQTVSGTFSGGNIIIERFDVGDFSEGPKPPDSISGTLEDGKLNLKFTPLPTNIRDGFTAEGNIQAEDF